MLRERKYDGKKEKGGRIDQGRKSEKIREKRSNAIKIDNTEAITNKRTQGDNMIFL